MMRHLGLSPLTKEDGLCKFQRIGWILVDATYEPVNDPDSSISRNDIILRDYRLLCDDLASLTPDRSVPLVLIKANVCRMLEPKLSEDGFNVLNRGREVFFPSHSHQRTFQRQFGAILENCSVES